MRKSGPIFLFSFSFLGLNGLLLRILPYLLIYFNSLSVSLSLCICPHPLLFSMQIILKGHYQPKYSRNYPQFLGPSFQISGVDSEEAQAGSDVQPFSSLQFSYIYTVRPQRQITLGALVVTSVNRYLRAALLLSLTQMGYWLFFQECRVKLLSNSLQDLYQLVSFQKGSVFVDKTFFTLHICSYIIFFPKD